MKLKILPLMLVIPVLTGCASNGKVNDKSYLRAAAVDDEKITFSFFSDEDENITVNADDLGEAKKSAELSTGKEIFTGYTELMLLDGSNSTDTLSYALNEWKVSPACEIVSPEKTGAELLRKCKPEELEGMVKTAIDQKLAEKCDIVTVLGSLLNTGGKTAVPKLSENGFCGNTNIN